ncbi:MAG: helix-turn-helix domain-containing protein, partial [Paracoccaceae bacterium]
MTAELPEITAPEDEVIGLRDRKKAQRRDRIIAAARALFAERGVDATTITDIAEACEISAPTVFNYFGSKDGILIAIIDEGTRAARESEKVMPRPAGTPLDKVLLDLFSRIAAQTLLIASKRVWRYAESAVIRHPETELSQTYREVGTKLVEAIADVLRACDLSTRAGAPAGIPLL